MNKRDKAILAWVKTWRPDCLESVESMLGLCYIGGNDQADAIAAMMFMAFEAGRQYQASDPTAALNQPHLYL